MKQSLSVCAFRLDEDRDLFFIDTKMVVEVVVDSLLYDRVRPHQPVKSRRQAGRPFVRARIQKFPGPAPCSIP